MVCLQLQKPRQRPIKKFVKELCGDVHTAERQRISIGFCTHFLYQSWCWAVNEHCSYTHSVYGWKGRFITCFRMVSGLSQWIMTTKATLQSKISENISR